MSTHTVLSKLLRPQSPAGTPRLRPAVPTVTPLPVLLDYFNILFTAYGPQSWWPGRTRFEVIVGAILTQNTSWRNASQAIGSLRREGLLNPAGIARTPVERLAILIRSSGYFREKARKLKEFVAFLESRHGGSLNAMFHTPTPELREQLLAVHGIGPETADCILLYAGEHPVFVIDAYTRRILERHELVPVRRNYEELRGLFEKSLPREAPLFNEFHALIVHVGKNFCRPKSPACHECPLRCKLPHSIEGAR